MRSASLTENLNLCSAVMTDPIVCSDKGKHNEDICTNQHVCQLCDSVYKKLGSLNNHMKTKHGIVEDCPLKCEVCDKYFENTKKLNRHKKSHK